MSWLDNLRGTVEGALTGLGDFIGGLQDRIFEGPPPPLPDVPEREPAGALDFGITSIPEDMRGGGDGELRHMAIVVAVDFLNLDGEDRDQEVYQMDAYQYDDEDILRRMILARMDEVDKEDIAAVNVWIDGEWAYEWDWYDFEPYPDEEGDTP